MVSLSKSLRRQTIRQYLVLSTLKLEFCHDAGLAEGLGRFAHLTVSQLGQGSNSGDSEIGGILLS